MHESGTKTNDEAGNDHCQGDDDLIILETDRVNPLEESSREFLKVNAWWRLVQTRAREFRQLVQDNDAFQQLSRDQQLDAFMTFMPARWIDDSIQEIDDSSSSGEDYAPDKMSHPVAHSAPTLEVSRHFRAEHALEAAAKRLKLEPASSDPPQSSSFERERLPRHPVCSSERTREDASSRPQDVPADQPSDVSVVVPYYASVWDVALVKGEGEEEDVEPMKVPRPVTLGAAYAVGNASKEEMETFWSKLSPSRSLVEELALKLKCSSCAVSIGRVRGRNTENGSSRVHFLPCGHPICPACAALSTIECGRCDRSYERKQAYPLYL